jgi:signal transduction histidine kinase
MVLNMSDENNFLSVARQLFGMRTRQDIYEVAVTSVVRLTEADECAIAVFEDGHPMSQASVTSGLIDAPRGPLADEFGLIERAYDERETILVADLAASSWGWKFPESAPDSPPPSEGIAPYQSLLCVPLESGELLVATADQPGVLNRETRQSAEGIGSLVEEALKKLPEISESAQPAPDPDRLETIASTLNHEMMSKLMVANTRLEAAKKNPKTEHFDHVADAHDRIETFVKDMTHYLRTGERIPDPERIDLGAVAERAWQVVETPEMELQRPENLKIVADKGMVSDLLENLFRNAAEHGFGSDEPASDDRQIVRIGQLKAGKGFYVEDNGRGIDPEYGKSVFESGVTTSTNGSGYGLSICQDIVAAHGWEIDFILGDNDGTCFEITGVEFAGDEGKRSCGAVTPPELSS